MRLLPVCLPLVLAPLIAAPLIAAGQQPQPTTTQKPAQTSAAKQVSSTAVHKASTRHRARHHRRKAAAHKGRKQAQSNAVPVDVINGEEMRHVVLDKGSTAEASSKAKSRQMKVEVINGSTAGTQVFSNNNQEAAHNQPVVVGVQSGDTRFAGGNKSPVVTGVTSSSSVDATSASSGGQPVAKQVSPRPKRPVYAPEQH
ncbi:hypothetical protein [Occallatibacter savannae]|uniref:hypothetical protein n=1 Tax=Occallatibacter savannae TaxID=1002691 RepID=UPI000D6989C4|nr:hypothetical protein [Occallatibacter savannae]